MERPDAHEPRDFHAPDNIELEALVDLLFESSDTEAFRILNHLMEVQDGLPD